MPKLKVVGECEGCHKEKEIVNMKKQYTKEPISGDEILIPTIIMLGGGMALIFGLCSIMDYFSFTPVMVYHWWTAVLIGVAPICLGCVLIVGAIMFPLIGHKERRSTGKRMSFVPYVSVVTMLIITITSVVVICEPECKYNTIIGRLDSVEYIDYSDNYSEYAVIYLYFPCNSADNIGFPFDNRTEALNIYDKCKTLEGNGVELIWSWDEWTKFDSIRRL